MHKRILPLLITAVCLSISHAATVLVDFQNEITDPGTAWNTISSNSATNEALNDTTEASSGINLSLDGWTSSTQTNAFLGREEAPAWATAGQNELNDRFFIGNSSTASITLSGLDPNLTYSIELVSSSASTTGSGQENTAGSPPGYLRVTDPDGVVNAFNGFNNSLLTGNDTDNQPDDTDGDWAAWSTAYYENEHNVTTDFGAEGWLVWSDIKPDGGNEITIDYTTLSGDSRGSINAMQITAIPEPGTLALVGIALGALLFFRRRK